jgi:hypothetical protein
VDRLLSPRKNDPRNHTKQHEQERDQKQVELWLSLRK